MGEICADDYEVQHVRTGGNFRFAGASLLPEDFAAACKAIVGCEPDEAYGTRFIRPPLELIDHFLKAHAMIGSIARTAPELFELPEVVRAVEHHLTHALIRCVTEGVVSAVNGSYLRHKLILTRFEEFLEANPNTPLYLSEVCEAIGAAERTLRAACRRARRHGAYPVPHLAQDASCPSRTGANSSVDGNRHASCHRPRFLGAGPLLGCLSDDVRRDALANIEPAG